MKKITKLSASALLISLFAVLVGKKLDDDIQKDKVEANDRGIGPID